jgi:hypothetical protein
LMIFCLFTLTALLTNLTVDKTSTCSNENQPPIISNILQKVLYYTR